MSSLIVDVCVVEEIRPHPNADKVELVRTKNWWVVSQIGYFKVGDKCVYFPPDSVISEDWANRFGIAKYLSPLGKNLDGTRPPGLRIRAQRFRGERSFGFIDKPDNPEWEVGTSVIDHYGVTKYDPPLKSMDGDSATPIAAFHGYTDIEHLGNFPGVLVDGEEVVVDEKIHGCVSKDTLIMLPNGEEIPIYQIRPGDKVLSMRIADSVFEHAEVADVVVRDVAKDWVRLTFDNGSTLVCTTDHLIFTNNGWKKAQEISEHDDIYTCDRKDQE